MRAHARRDRMKVSTGVSTIKSWHMQEKKTGRGEVFARAKVRTDSAASGTTARAFSFVSVKAVVCVQPQDGRARVQERVGIAHIGTASEELCRFLLMHKLRARSWM